MAHKNEEDAAAQLAQFVAELEAMKRKKLKREEEVSNLSAKEVTLSTFVLIIHSSTSRSKII